VLRRQLTKALGFWVDIKQYFSEECGVALKEASEKINKQIGSIPFKRRDATYGVDGSTLRAFRGWSNSPGLIYREWACGICDSLCQNGLSIQINSRADFLDWHEYLASSLQLFWQERQYGKLSTAHLYKLVDLFVKWLSRHDFNNEKLTSAFVHYGNCALDKKTLNKINECLSNVLPLVDPSMGDVGCKRSYDFCQDLIFEFAGSYGSTRLLFDYFAWQY
jgi:hypothetical protein